MDVNSINKIKDASKSSKFGPWVDWWDEMARKSVFKRLAKWLPLDADVDDLIDYDNSIDRPEPEPVAVVAQPAKKASKLDAIVQEEPEVVEVDVVEEAEAAPAAVDDF